MPLRFIAQGSHQRRHQFAQRPPLGERCGEAGRQGPRRLRLGMATTRSRSTIKLHLDPPLELVQQGLLVLGCSQ
jgi:hypothetical protein